MGWLDEFLHGLSPEETEKRRKAARQAEVDAVDIGPMADIVNTPAQHRQARNFSTELEKKRLVSGDKSLDIKTRLDALDVGVRETPEETQRIRAELAGPGLLERVGSAVPGLASSRGPRRGGARGTAAGALSGTDKRRPITGAEPAGPGLMDRLSTALSEATARGPRRGGPPGTADPTIARTSKLRPITGAGGPEQGIMGIIGRGVDAVSGLPDAVRRGAKSFHTAMGQPTEYQLQGRGMAPEAEAAMAEPPPPPLLGLGKQNLAQTPAATGTEIFEMEPGRTMSEGRDLLGNPRLAANRSRVSGPGTLSPQRGGGRGPTNTGDAPAGLRDNPPVTEETPTSPVANQDLGSIYYGLTPDEESSARWGGLLYKSGPAGRAREIRKRKAALPLRKLLADRLANAGSDMSAHERERLQYLLSQAEAGDPQYIGADRQRNFPIRAATGPFSTQDYIAQGTEPPPLNLDERGQPQEPYQKVGVASRRNYGRTTADDKLSRGSAVRHALFRDPRLAQVMRMTNPRMIEYALAGATDEEAQRVLDIVFGGGSSSQGQTELPPGLPEEYQGDEASEDVWRYLHEGE